MLAAVQDVLYVAIVYHNADILKERDVIFTIENSKDDDHDVTIIMQF